jgi:deazaflavin-dependent oxidoreductase (nitroreductase family)
MSTLMHRIAGSEPFLRIAPHVVPRFDRLVHRLTRGRVSVSQRMVPSVMLHATGAKSGQRRDVPLAALPDGDAFYVVGSNFGREGHPAWTANLLAHPEVAVTVRGRRTDARARLLDADEKAAVWPRLTAMWPNYDRYVERSGRDLRVFRLEPRGGPGG